MLNIFGSKVDVAETATAISNGLDKLFTSDEERQQAKVVMERLRQSPHELQAITNKIAASHKSWFVAGGRPWLIWVCGFNLLQLGIAATWFNLTPPEWYVDMITTITLGVLGLYGTMRSYEKVKGKTR